MVFAGMRDDELLRAEQNEFSILSHVSVYLFLPTLLVCMAAITICRCNELLSDLRNNTNRRNKCCILS